MKTIKFTEAKTEKMKRAINLLDMYRSKSSLKEIKAQAMIAGIELKGRTFKVIHPQLVEFYETAMASETATTLKGAKTLTVTFLGRPLKIIPKIRTTDEIYRILAGTNFQWVKRRNARTKMIAWSNELVNNEIDALRVKIRQFRSTGTKEQSLRTLYSEVTQFELKLL